MDAAGIYLTLVALLMNATPPAFSQSDAPFRSQAGDVIFELIGQVINPSPTSSIQFGYLPYVKGIETAFAPGGAQNETTALFTFYNETTTLGVINNGPLRIISREGTTTIYYNPTPSRHRRAI